MSESAIITIGPQNRRDCAQNPKTETLITSIIVVAFLAIGGLSIGLPFIPTIGESLKKAKLILQIGGPIVSTAALITGLAASFLIRHKSNMKKDEITVEDIYENINTTTAISLFQRTSTRQGQVQQKQIDLPIDVMEIIFSFMQTLDIFKSLPAISRDWMKLTLGYVSESICKEESIEILDGALGAYNAVKNRLGTFELNDLAELKKLEGLRDIICRIELNIKKEGLIRDTKDLENARRVKQIMSECIEIRYLKISNPFYNDLFFRHTNVEEGLIDEGLNLHNFQKLEELELDWLRNSPINREDFFKNENLKKITINFTSGGDDTLRNMWPLDFLIEFMIENNPSIEFIFINHPIVRKNHIFISGRSYQAIHDDMKIKIQENLKNLRDMPVMQVTLEETKFKKQCIPGVLFAGGLLDNLYDTELKITMIFNKLVRNPIVIKIIT